MAKIKNVIQYEDAYKLALTVEWKLSICSEGKECWCRIIEPKKKLKYGKNNTEEVYIVHSGAIPKIFAEHIVLVHNVSLKK